MNDGKKKRINSILSIGVLLFIACVFVMNLRTTLVAAKDFLLTFDLPRISTDFEGSYNGTFPYKNAFVDINGLGHRLFQQRKMTDVFLLENGHVSAVLADCPDENLQNNAEAIIQFSDWFETKHGGNFLYVQVPMKNSKYQPMLPAGITDASNDIADRFLANLEGKVDNLDLRQPMEAETDFYSLYLKTEHHWNGEGGFFAFQKICQYMQEHFGEEIAPMVLDSENYEHVTLQESSLGYYGQKTGQYFAGYDEFPIIYPKFETRQTCTIVHRELTRTGSFYDTVFDWDFLKTAKRNRGLYGLYIGGDFPLVSHHSETAQNPGTVMLFIDSYGTIVESYLTTAYQNVVAVDLRWVLRQGWEESAYDFINQYKPDTVIVAFNPNQLIYADSEQFVYGIPETELR